MQFAACATRMRNSVPSIAPCKCFAMNFYFFFFLQWSQIISFVDDILFYSPDLKCFVLEQFCRRNVSSCPFFFRSRCYCCFCCCSHLSLSLLIFIAHFYWSARICCAADRLRSRKNSLNVQLLWYMYPIHNWNKSNSTSSNSKRKKRISATTRVVVTLICAVACWWSVLPLEIIPFHIILGSSACKNILHWSRWESERERGRDGNDQPATVSNVFGSSRTRLIHTTTTTKSK